MRSIGDVITVPTDGHSGGLGERALGEQHSLV